MEYSVINKRFINILLIFGFLAAFVGCADKNTKKDPFFEKWSTMAENSPGHSPSAEPKKIDMAALSAKQALSTGKAAAKQMPSKKINLTMRQADLKAVLRAMAKAVDLNLLMKNDIKGDVSVDFRGVAWDEAFTGLLRTYGLSYIWEGKIIRVMTLDDIDRDLKQKMSLRDIQWVEPLLQPVVINIDYTDPKKLSETLQDFLTKDKDGKPRGSVKVDEHSNSLVISAMHDDLAKMLPIIEKLDKPTPQIQIKANIVETTKSTARDLGIMWGGQYQSSSGNFGAYPGGTRDSTVTTAPPDANSIAGGGVGRSGRAFASNFPAANLTSTAAGSLALLFGTIGGNILETQLQALQTDNKLNILSSPSITTLDNQKAFTENGAKVPYSTLDTSVTPPTRTVKFEDVVLRLEITPHVIDGKNLKMSIVVKKDEVDLTRNVDGNPYIIKKQTQTVLIVKDGETIVISGLTKQTISGGDKGWPWLKDVPVLGWLFKSDSKSESMEEVLIFITPTILQAHIPQQNVSSSVEESTINGTEAGNNNKKAEKN
ncbi:MAG: type IV pilus secretin PilQ [Smithellaceae bacterium]